MKDELLLASTDYTNDTQVPLLLAASRSDFPFVALKKKMRVEEVSSPSFDCRIRQKRNNPRDLDVATPHPSARKTPRTTSTTSSSSSSSSTKIIDLTNECDCNDEYTPHIIGIKRPRGCSICMNSPASASSSSITGRIGHAPY